MPLKSYASVQLDLTPRHHLSLLDMSGSVAGSAINRGCLLDPACWESGVPARVLCVGASILCVTSVIPPQEDLGKKVEVMSKAVSRHQKKLGTKAKQACETLQQKLVRTDNPSSSKSLPVINSDGMPLRMIVDS